MPDIQHHHRLLFDAIDEHIRWTGQDQFARVGNTPRAAQVRETAKQFLRRIEAFLQLHQRRRIVDMAREVMIIRCTSGSLVSYSHSVTP